MSNPLSKEAFSCKKWGNYVIHSERGVLIALWYIVLLIGEKLSGSSDIISAREASATYTLPIGGIIGLYGLICVIGCLIFPIIWCNKSYNFLLKYKPDEKFYAETGGQAALLRSIPIFHFYSKVKIMKDLYRNLTEEKINKKKGIRIRYICFILCLLFILVFLAGSVVPLPYMNIVNFFIALIFATISIGTFNNMIQTMGNFFETFNVVKGVTKKYDGNVEADTISNEVITEEVKAEKEVKTKKFNYKPVLYIALILALAWLFIPFTISTIRMNKNTKYNETTNNVKVEEKKQEKKEETKENNITMSDQQIFENTIKCQEFKDKFFDEMTTYFTSNSVYDQKIGSQYYPLLRAGKENITIFYSPVTNSCIGTAYGTGAKWSDSFVLPEIVEGLFVVQDIFSSDRCKVKETIYYHDDGILGQRIDFFNKCDGLTAYDDEIFTRFTIPGDELYNNLNLAKEIFDNQVNYLKGN